MQLAKLLGAKQVIALAGSDSKLELVRELGGHRPFVIAGNIASNAVTVYVR